MVIEVHRLAHYHARRLVRDRDRAQDAAQDVVLNCLIAVREGKWSAGRRSLDAHVSCLVRRRLAVLRRDHGRAMLKDMEHVRDREPEVQLSREPELSSESAELEAKYAAAVKKLSPACLRAYELVRGEKLSYAEAAKQLGVGKETVKWHVVQAQREFQKAFGKRRGRRGWVVYEPPADKPKKRRPGRPGKHGEEHVPAPANAE